MAEKAAGNVQASIKNIHIRYEDDTSIPEVCAAKIKAESQDNQISFVISILSLPESPSQASSCFQQMRIGSRAS